jgi:hypothetical protein
MKTIKILAAALFTLGIFVAGCSKNPVADDPNSNPGGNTAPPYSRSDIAAVGVVDTTADGFNVTGTAQVNTPDGNVSFVNADMGFVFDSAGNLTGVSGKAEIPSPSKDVEFTNPVEAEVGYFSGAYINAHPEFTLTVKADRHYFVFYFAVALEMKIATNGDPGASKPISIKAPIGGKAVMIVDYNDPLTYTYGEQDLLGAMGWGDSFKGLIPFSPVQPLDNFPDFDGQSIRVGSFDVFKILGVSGHVIQSRRYSADLHSDDIFGSMKAGAWAGINGEMDFAIGVKDIIGFTVPLGEASAGISFEASTSGVLGRAALNGVVEPDNSWWPGVVGFTPSGQMRAKGHLLTTGDFQVALSGGYSIATPGKTTSLQGETVITHTGMELRGSRTVNDTTMTVVGRVTKDLTEFGMILPDQLKFDGQAIQKEIDSELDEADQALADLEKATADYELELSLRGLRKSLPGIVDNAKTQIADGIASAKKKVRDATTWCSGHPDLSVIDDLAKPYISSLNRLKAAALNTSDNGTTRKEIEAALRDLASRNRIKKTITISGKIKKIICVSYSTTRSIDITVISSTQVSQLLTAANNVKYIQETSDLKIAAQVVFDAIAPRDILQRVRTEIANGVAQIPSVDEVGFTHTWSPSAWEFYAILSGEKHVIGGFDPMNPAEVQHAISSLIVDLIS